MASIPCISNQSSLHNPTILHLLHIVQLHTRSKPIQFLGIRKRLGWLEPSKIGPSSSGSRAAYWFRFGKNGVDAVSAGICGSQSRDDFDRDDVEQVVEFALALQEVGCFSVVLECVLAPVAAAAATFALRISTIGIGAGAFCSGKVN